MIKTVDSGINKVTYIRRRGISRNDRRIFKAVDSALNNNVRKRENTTLNTRRKTYVNNL